MSTKNKKNNKIKWNEVTWYSKLLAIIFFIGLWPMITFYIGMCYQQIMNDYGVDSKIQIF